MKNKLFTIITVMFMVLLLSGCGKKVTYLNCVHTQDKTVLDYNVKFVGKTVEEMDIKLDMDVSEYNDIQIEAIGKQDYCAVLASSMPQYKDALDNCKQDIVEKHLVVTSDLLVDKVASSEKEKMGSIEETKKAIEATGYTCTTK